MPIYTKTGDGGITSLYGGKRIPKSHPQVEAYGSIDELSSFIGLTISKTKDKETTELLTLIQKDLYQIMGYLGGAKTELDFIEKRVVYFEKKIDQSTGKLPPINQFILPQGNESSSWFHVLRTVCRRAERAVVRMLNNKPADTYHPTPIIQYLNRLSDLFFTLARSSNIKKEILV